MNLSSPRSRFLHHALLLSLLMGAALWRAAWDPFTQFLVSMGWSFAGGLTCVLMWRRRARDSNVPEVFRTAGPFFGALLMLSVLSALRGYFPHSVGPGLLAEIPAVGFFFAAAGASRDWERAYQRGIAGVAVVGAFIAWAGAESWTAPWTGTLVNPNLLAGLLLLGGPLAVGLGASRELGPRERWFWRIGAGGIVLGVLGTQSFAGYLVLGLEAVLGGVWYWSHQRGERQKKVGVWILGGVLFFAALSGLYQAKWGRLLGESDRWAWWSSAAAMVRAHPLLGVGPGAFGEAYPAFRVEPWGLNSLYAHNFLMEWAAERGLPSAILFTVFLGILLFRSPKNPDIPGRGLVVSLVGFLAYNLFHIGMSFPGLSWLFWAVAGLRWGNSLPSRTPWMPPRWVASLGAVVWGLYGFSSYALFRSDQLTAEARSVYAQGDFQRLESIANQGLRWNRWSPELYNLRAAARLARGDEREAFEDMRRCLRRAPTGAGFHRDAAELAWRAGDRPAALQYYDRAVRLLPLSVVPWVRRGDLLQAAGRAEESRASYKNALRALTDPRVLGGSSAVRDALRSQVLQRLGRERPNP